MKMWKKCLLLTALAAAGGLGGFFWWLHGYLPDVYTVAPGEPLVLAQQPYVTASAQSQSPARMAGASANSGRTSTRLMLFGIFPLKKVWVQETPQVTVMVSGAPFGIKLFSNGVMVVGFSDVYTPTGYQNPAKSAGIRMGDTIHSINGTPVAANEDIQNCVEDSQGRPMAVLYSRKGREDTVYVTPVRDESSQSYRIGMWVRDSSAGIGTLTYYLPAGGAFAGLGHPVTDVDTGESIDVLSGEIVAVNITGVAPSSPGSPGELKGILSAETSGNICDNDTTGVYGVLLDGAAEAFGGRACTVAQRQQVTVGPATLFACISGSEPRAFSVEIERISYSENAPNKNMIVRVTDPELLKVTGGIVQGMSGSPIVQNGRLVGAVTHVLVNDPTRGYAIFAENMVEAQQDTAGQTIKLAA